MEVQIKDIISIISKGQTDKAISQLQKIRSSFSFGNKIEIDTISSRYNSLRRAQIGNLISFEEGERELAKINNSLLVILNSNLKEAETEEDDLFKKLESLGEKYIESKKIKNRPFRLREKNQITRKICQMLIEHPELMDKSKESKNQGILSGIAYKVRIVPDIEHLDLLESIAENSSSNFAKGNIVNALGELVYSGQLRLGDDYRILSLLGRMKENSDEPLVKNVERVESALGYLLKRN